VEKLFVIKIGGNIIDDEVKLSTFLASFASIPDKKILVHGGGKLATTLAARLQVPQQLIDGRRITDAATLEIVTMVYAGLVNKSMVAKLQANGCDAIGLCGADANIVLAHQRVHPSRDYGYVGDIDRINRARLQQLLDGGLTPVLAPLTHNGEGQLLNTNADTLAQEIAKELSTSAEVHLIYSFDKSGVLMDIHDDRSVIPTIRPAYYEQLKTEQKIFAGMIPKMDNAFAALRSGVKQVIIGKAEQLQELLTHSAGTIISNENT
jgi:acetylglutamate kinase